MARQNTRNRFGGREEDEVLWTREDATTNYEGGLAFQMDDLLTAYTMAASNLFGEPKFYKEVSEDGIVLAQNQDNKLLKLIRKLAVEQPEFVMQLAAFCRNELYLRTIPVIMWVEAATVRPRQNNSIIRKYAPSILKRADEPGEAIAYFLARNGSFLGTGGRYPHRARKGVVLSHAIQKGIEDAIFTNYDRYQISKYDRKNASVKWRDVINLVHPSPANGLWGHDGTSEISAVIERWNILFKDILSGKLAPAETWEDTLMNFREKGFESKKAAWESIIPKMGYMALLRNLRNFIEQDIDKESLLRVINTLKDPEQVKRSKQFPYRFHSAYKSVETLGTLRNPPLQQKLQTALEDAMEVSTDNLPKWKGTTFIAADWSASMDGTVSSKSQVTRREIAGLLMCMSAKLCENAICSVFGSNFSTVSIHERDGILSNLQRILNVNVGHSTNAYLTIQYLYENNIKVDRFVLFSDLQCYNDRDKDVIARYTDIDSYSNGSYRSAQIAPLWNRYKRDVNPDAYLYSFDLAGYGTSQLPIDTHRLCLLGGFSDKILSFVPVFESDKTGAIEKIKSITPETYRKKKKNRQGQHQHHHQQQQHTDEEEEVETTETVE